MLYLYAYINELVSKTVGSIYYNKIRLLSNIDEIVIKLLINY